MPSGNETFFTDMVASTKQKHIFKESNLRVVGPRGGKVILVGNAEAACEATVKLGQREVTPASRVGLPQTLGENPDVQRDVITSAIGLPNEEIFVDIENLVAAANEVRMKLVVEDL